MAKKKKTGFSDLLAREQDLRLRKMTAKLPDWAGCDGLLIPQSLPLEQCSSSQTASFKARLLESVLPSRGTAADLTGGLGADSWALSRVFSRVLYFERNEDLCRLARQNFETLSASGGKPLNIECQAAESGPDLIESLGQVDCVYADPARRSESGRKVFLIEDCSPDMTSLIPHIAKVSPYLLIKYSPMADITMLRGRLSILEDYPVRSTGVIGLNGEVKELLVMLSSNPVPLPQLYIADAGTQKIMPLDGIAKDARFLSPGEPPEGKVLIEPGAVLLKSGCQDAICHAYEAKKAGRDCHLYVSDSEPCKEELDAYVKKFRIIESAPLNKAALKEIGRRYPVAEVSARGLHLKSEELSGLLGCRSGIAEDGGHYHIFGLAIGKQKYVIAGRRL